MALEEATGGRRVPLAVHKPEQDEDVLFLRPGEPFFDRYSDYESGGKQKSGRTRKGNRWLCSLLVQDAVSAGRSKGTYAGAFYHRVARRRGKERATVATGHHLARAMYHVLREGKAYQDLGADYLDQHNHDTLKNHLIRWLEGLGYRGDLMPEVTVA